MSDIAAPVERVLDDPCVEPCDACAARGVSICRVLPHRQLRRLADCMVEQEFAAGATLFGDGDPGGALFNITDGVVKLFKLMPDGRRQVIGFLFRGDFLGVSVGDHHTLWAEAITPVRACRFPRAAFYNLLRDSPELYEELLSRAADELRVAQAQMVLLGRKTAQERLATFLVDMADRERRRGAVPGLVTLPMTRSDIADYLGLTIETVSRAVTAFETAGFVRRLDRGALALLQPDVLARLARI